MRKFLPAPGHSVTDHILLVRGHKVLLDSILATLYGVRTKVLLQSVRRNSKRFPPDFMFQLSREEVDSLRSHFVTSKRGGRRYLPLVFTEQGVAMLSSVIRSSRAIDVNIAIMRAFVRLRETVSANKELAEKFKELESHISRHDQQIATIFKAIRQLMTPPESPERRIGF